MMSNEQPTLWSQHPDLFVLKSQVLHTVSWMTCNYRDCATDPDASPSVWTEGKGRGVSSGSSFTDMCNSAEGNIPPTCFCGCLGDGLTWVTLRIAQVLPHLHFDVTPSTIVGDASVKGRKAMLNYRFGSGFKCAWWVGDCLQWCGRGNANNIRTLELCWRMAGRRKEKADNRKYS